jgi:predicted XRE-type DNA-binding protein
VSSRELGECLYGSARFRSSAHARDGALGAAPGDCLRISPIDSIPALKQQLGRDLARLLAGWNADDIAVLIGTDRPRISELRRAKLDRFSLETLIRYLTRLGHRVDVSVTREPLRRRVNGGTL